MTSREAAEIILEGAPWARCTFCGGFQSDSSEFIECTNCTVDGVMVRPEHLEACQVLGIHPPHLLGNLDCTEEWGVYRAFVRKLRDEDGQQRSG